MLFEDEQLHWFAIQVRANHERIANAVLEQKGFCTFLPVYRARSLWSDRIKIVERPVFPGYFFCLLHPQKRQPVVTVHSIVRIVGVGNTPTPVDAGELAAVHAIVSSDLPCAPQRYLQAGEPVKIVAGPLRGLEGILQRQRGVHRVIVSVNLIRQSVAVEIDDSSVMPLIAGPRSEPSLTVGSRAQAIQ